MKKPQTTIAPTFLTDIISAIDGVNGEVLNVTPGLREERYIRDRNIVLRLFRILVCTMVLTWQMLISN